MKINDNNNSNVGGRGTEGSLVVGRMWWGVYLMNVSAGECARLV